MLTSSLVKKTHVPVRVEAIETASTEIPIFAIGRIAPETETKLSFKTGGYIASLTAREGDYIKKGKLLGRLQTQEIDNQVDKAKRAVEKAKRDLDRIQKMYEDSVATYENVQDITTQLAIASADLNIAEFNQTHSRILSPVSGRILKKLSENNELVSPGQPIYVLTSGRSNAYVLSIFLSDKDIGMISFDARAEISFDAFPGETFEASVSKISESADPRTGTFEVELQLKSTKKRLRNGMIGRVKMLPAQMDSYIKIPMVAIAEGAGDRIKVYIPSQGDSVARSTTLKVMRYADDFVWASSEEVDLSRVITSGSAFLKDGQKIRIQ